MTESYHGEGTAMKEQLQTLIEQKISEWQRDGIYENIYALSLYVFNEEDDPRRPVAVLGYNTRQQAEQSVPLASDGQEARWNYAFWLQNEELCWGLGDTAETVSQWVDGLGLEDEEEIAGAFWKLLTIVVKEIRASGLLKDRFGAEIPILIHGLEYDQETARQNLEANGETLDRDFLAFCGLEQDGSNTDWDSIMGATVRWRSPGIQSGPNADWCHIKGKPMIRQKEENPQKEAMITPDIPKKFNCGRQKADMRHVMAFILIIIFVMFTLDICGIFRIGPGTVPDIEENGLVGQSIAEEETVSGSMETEENPAASGSHEGQGAALESEQTEKSGQEQDTAAGVTEDGEEYVMRWQIYIHPDVPQPLTEVLKQYEVAMNVGTNGVYIYVGDDDVREKAGIEGPYFIDLELYGAWCTAVENGWDETICYSLRDLTGDGIPELIMGNGDLESAYIRVVYECTAEGDIRVTDSSTYYDMTLYEGDIIEYVSGGVACTITYLQFSQKEQDWRIVEALGKEWDYENAREVGPYRQIITDGEYAEKEMISEKEFERIRAQYTQKEMELEWYSLTNPSWHIPVASNEFYDVYLEGNSTDLWLAERDVRQLYFSIYDKEGALVQELVETSPYLRYMPSPYYEGNFYFEDMNFDGAQDLMLQWVNINHPLWNVYLWREDEGVFREEPKEDVWGEEGVFGYYFIEEEQEYIDETVPEGDGYTIYRTRYDRGRGYYHVGALFVYFGDEEGTQDEEEERLKEYFYEDGVYQGCTDVISKEEVSELWSDLWE